MIHVFVEKQKERIVAFHIEGHSGYADRGSDIICSAVSALAINCVNSIEELTEDSFSIGQDDEIGLLDFRFEGDISDTSNILLQSLLIGLQGISQSYGSKYVTVEIVRRK